MSENVQTEQEKPAQVEASGLPDLLKSLSPIMRKIYDNEGSFIDVCLPYDREDVMTIHSVYFYSVGVLIQYELYSCPCDMESTVVDVYDLVNWLEAL